MKANYLTATWSKGRGERDANAIVRSFDWTDTPLGAPDQWPQPLKTLVEVMLAANQPMFLVWGSERTLIYNTPYSEILQDRHPSALGRDFLDVWSEVRTDLDPIVGTAYSGEPVHMDDIVLLLRRRSRTEDAHFTFSYTPVRDEAGQVAGFFCPCTETTAQFLAERERDGEVARQRRLFEQAPGFIAVLAEPDHRFQFANAAYRKLIAGRDPTGRTVRDVLPELEGQSFFELLDQVYRSGERHIAHDTRIEIESAAGMLEERFLDFIYEPVRDHQNRVTGIFVEGHDVTEAHRAREAVREREERLRLVIDGARDYAIMTLDPERRITSWSAGAAEAFGLSAEEAIGRLSDDLFLADDVAAGAPEGEVQTARTKGCARDERWHRRADATAVFINGSVHPLPSDEQGRPRGFLKIGRDETAQRKREEELSRTRVDLVESEGRFRTLAEAAPALIFLSERERGNVWVNQRYQEYTGRTAAELLGIQWREVVHAEDLLEPATRVAGASVAGERFEGRLRIRRGDGAYRWHLCRAEPLQDPDSDAATRSLGVCFDIHDQVCAEQALRLSEERFRTALEIETVGVIYFDMQGVLIDANDAFLSISGFTRTELEARELTWQRLTPPEWFESSERAFAELKTRGSTSPYEKEYFRKDGTRWWALFAAKLLPDGTGFEFVLDITDRKVAEDRLRELNETLEHRIAEEVAVRSRTEDALRQSQKLEAIGQLTGGVAHDFNNLLTIIRSSADLLRRPEVTAEKQRRYIDAISDTADRAAKLTSQLLAFARRQALRPEIFDSAARVEAVGEMLRTVLGARIELVIESRCAPCFVEADTGQFETALVNMAVNARDAMDGEGILRIVLDEVATMPALRGHAATPGEFTTVSMSDTGAGIAPDDLARIFEPFFTTKEVGKGTGLGLSQVFGFAKQSGGEVAVESTVGKGTTFTLYLPRASAASATSGEGERPVEVPVAPGRILIVEDNVAVGEFASQLLEDLGYTTELAGNAVEALAKLGDPGAAFDVVFSDVVMPGMGGVELGRRIRERWPGLPVVLTSGYSQVLAEDSRHGFSLLRKPYSVEELSRVLSTATLAR